MVPGTYELIYIKMLKFFNETDSDVTFANDCVVHIKYDGTDAVALGSRVMYEMDPTWWGYVGKVVATIVYNFTTELIVRYDHSVSGFANTDDAYEYFDEVV
jgi:hypothetical protein